MLGKNATEWIWDAWCIFSIIGIWPRFVEPRILKTTYLKIPISHLPHELNNIKILHFSDLHWDRTFFSILKKQIIRKVRLEKPDLIVFTGDFICRSKIEKKNELKEFLNSFQAPLGCYAVLGNHDYDQFVTISPEGDYDVEIPSSESLIVKGFRRLFSSPPLTGKVSENAKNTKPHQDLLELLNQTSFQLLNNCSHFISYKGTGINICGLEEYTLQKFNPSEAFKNYQSQSPGIILTHNPDTFKILEDYPGDLILAGHTHGGQVNLPFLWKRFTRLENMQFKSGLKRLKNKWGYVNRGIASVVKFRWFAFPELTVITLQKG